MDEAVLTGMTGMAVMPRLWDATTRDLEMQLAAQAAECTRQETILRAALEQRVKMRQETERTLQALLSSQSSRRNSA